MKNDNDYEYNYPGDDNGLYEGDGNNKKPGPVNYVIGLIFLLWFAASVFLAIYYSKYEYSQWRVPIVILHIFIVICSIGIIQSLLEKKKPQLMLIFIDIGGIAGIIFVCIYHFNESESFKDLLIRLLVVAFLLVFVAIGVTTLVKSLLGRSAIRKRCTEPVFAVCKKADETIRTINNKTQRICTLVYELERNGEITELHDKIVSNYPPTVGMTRKLMINPENPAEFYDPAEPNKLGDEFMVGIMFTIIPLIMLILTLIYAF